MKNQPGPQDPHGKLEIVFKNCFKSLCQYRTMSAWLAYIGIVNSIYWFLFLYQIITSKLRRWKKDEVLAKYINETKNEWKLWNRTDQELNVLHDILKILLDRESKQRVKRKGKTERSPSIRCYLPPGHKQSENCLTRFRSGVIKEWG